MGFKKFYITIVKMNIDSNVKLASYLYTKAFLCDMIEI